MDTTPFPEADAPDLERYWLYARIEILAWANRLCAERVPMTIYWGGDGECAVSQILEVDDVRNELMLDMPSLPELQAKLMAAAELVCVAFVDNIKVQFSARSLQRSTSGGYAALRVRLPERLLRLQRREYFRVRTPDTLSASCLVPYAGDRGQYESLRVLDLSVGGMAMLAYPRHFDPNAAGVIDHCFLDLPGVGTVTVRMHVAHVEEAGEGQPRRCGCEFVDLSPQARMMLQRYVQRIDIEQRNRVGRYKAA